MPELPEGHQEAFSKETAKEAFAHRLSKAEYLQLLDQQREGTLKAIDRIGDAGLDKPAPEGYRRMFPTVADVLLLVVNHEVMHAGQFTVVRRKLGKPHAF
jgi:uncharacterized damage-inducible protein DinB